MGGAMNIKKKLSLGLGFLFLIIFGLVFFGSYEIGKLSRDANGILKDNYQSLVYGRNMSSALEVMRTSVVSLVFNPSGGATRSDYYLQLFGGARSRFEASLQSELNNITEINEKAYVDALNQDYGLFIGLCLRVTGGEGSPALYFNQIQPAFQRVAGTINDITDINMQAVERRSQMTKSDSRRIVSTMAVVGIVCLILAFGYFWYFPFFVSNSIAHLAGRMRALLDKSGLSLDIRTNDEAHILLQGINLLENRLDADAEARARPKAAKAAGRQKKR
jgi:hypothetical protein